MRMPFPVSVLLCALVLLALPCQGYLLLRMSSGPQKIAIFGASGKTGQEVAYRALDQGCKVAAFVRDPAKLCIPQGSGGDLAGQPLKNDGLAVFQGDVTNLNDVKKVFEKGDVDGVVIALGGKTKDVGKSMLTAGTKNVIEAMREKGVKRVAVVSSIGAGDSEKQAPLFFKVLMYTVMKDIFADKNNQERLFINGPGSDLEWCLVRPGGLGVGPATGVINVIDGEAGSIMRADVADFCLGAVLEKDFEYVRKAPCISSVGGTGWVKQKGKNFDEVTKA
uniref:NAD(P)-binding domain-containing protein n=1 Tax=Chromera velia CCMP2878 TaxID=1169474 RepID=A0A0G4GNW0_9ALVE|mmetsp:Transcript_31673/g.62686  ORF Transcript_31673/g.62686 Transcript_31673/m.62686 type:complete len:278 (+) Transcript_31673:108-941(+)|eukprot:Cvel_22720.t1-p1 / transcript=Cvel_22720.t1 / gene=Cvel_22720 / organism=Chromera_velia_CCMP2878 / gene_product=Uncharacterized protein At2g34460, chloroplastic, putative / transcript_product=Uncharacterized protein At2g34460, chloroplastic, putative / location=Cvel_scaffold2264:8213-9798(-) / protein_length=277 / sequence_SO=supercontig / SO=protein_coding / is_pseudo=false